MRSDLRRDHINRKLATTMPTRVIDFDPERYEPVG
jgi:hypothetical protein